MNVDSRRDKGIDTVAYSPRASPVVRHVIASEKKVAFRKKKGFRFVSYVGSFHVPYGIVEERSKVEGRYLPDGHETRGKDDRGMGRRHDLETRKESVQVCVKAFRRARRASVMPSLTDSHRANPPYGIHPENDVRE